MKRALQSDRLCEVSGGCLPTQSNFNLTVLKNSLSQWLFAIINNFLLLMKQIKVIHWEVVFYIFLATLLTNPDT